MDNKELKDQCIQLFLEGKTYTEIAKLTGWSRTFITNLIKKDKRFLEKKNTRNIKVSKRKNGKQMVIYIPTDFIEKLGISKDLDKPEHVNISVNEKNKTITIKKHF